MIQLSVAVRNARQDAIESTIGTSPKLQLRTGAPPANCAAAATGTLVREITLPSDWAAAASNGSKDKAGTWTDNSAGAEGVVGHYRMVDNAGTTCHEQGTVAMAKTLVTNGVTAANSNVLNFAATTGVVAGMKVTSGTGVVADSYVLAVTGTTVTLDKASVAGVGSGVSIVFGGDLTLDNTSVTPNQTITISTWSKTDGNA